MYAENRSNINFVGFLAPLDGYIAGVLSEDINDQCCFTLFPRVWNRDRVRGHPSSSLAGIVQVWVPVSGSLVIGM